MSDAILEVRNLDAHYGEFKALFDVSLHVSEGEVLAIIGSNGAGKSTLLNSIVGLIKNQPEMIRYRGEAIGDLDAFARTSNRRSMSGCRSSLVSAEASRR